MLHNRTGLEVLLVATRADRYPRVGWDRPTASDHCPVVVEIEVPAGPRQRAAG